MSGPTRVGGRPSQARERILAATLEALRDLDAERVLTAIGVAEIARRAGVGTSSVYHHVGSLSGLAEAVVQHVYDPGPPPAGVVKALEVAQDEFPLDVTLAAHASELDRLLNDPQFKARMAFWAFGGQQAREVYRDYLQALDHRLVVALGEVYRAWNREPRPPVDLAGLLAALGAVLNGATTRELVDPDPNRVHQFPRISSAMSSTMLRRIGDHRDLDDRLAELNYYPRERGDVGVQDDAAATRSRILYAAGELFRLQAYEATTIAQIARRADTTPRSVHHHYGDKRRLAVALLRVEAADRLHSTRTTSPAEALRRHLLAVASFAGDRRGYLAPYLAELMVTTEHADDVVLDRTALRLESAGHHHIDAVTVVLVLLQRLMHLPTTEHAVLVDGVLELVGCG